MAPPPGRPSAVIVPSWPSTTSRTSATPQPEPGALEPGEQPLGVAGIQARAVVPDREQHRVPAARQGDPDVPAGSRVAQRVVQQRRQHPAQRRLHPAHDRLAGPVAAHLDAHLPQRGPGVLGRGQLGGQHGHVHRAERAAQLLEPGRPQQVLDHLAELPGAVDELVHLVDEQDGVGAAADAALQQLGAGVQAGQRGAQLVADVGGEAPLAGQGRARPSAVSAGRAAGAPGELRTVPSARSSYSHTQGGGCATGEPRAVLDGDRPAGAQSGLAQRVRQPPDQLQQLAARDDPGSVLERRGRGGSAQCVEQGVGKSMLGSSFTAVAYCPMSSYNGIHIRGGSETSLT